LHETLVEEVSSAFLAARPEHDKPTSGVRSMLSRIKNRIWTRVWTDAQVAKYVGAYRSVYFTHASDPGVREWAASGGSVSALLTMMLQEGEIEGAVVVRTEISGGRVLPRFVLARTPQEILEAQGSKYQTVHFAREAFPLIAAAHGKVAVVALPCDARILYNYRQRHPEFDQKISLVICLLCGHNSEPALTEAIVARLGRAQGPLTRFVYRFGHWRGRVLAEFEGGAPISVPFARFSDYQNLYFFAQRKCHYCFDHLGYYGDLSAGDIWSKRMRSESLKKTALICRTEMGEKVVRRALESGALVGTQEEIREVLDGQARTLPFHYNLSARSTAGKLIGERVPDLTQEKVRLNEMLAALMVLVNERVSRSRTGRRLILALPRPLLKAYLFLLKGLESL